MSTKQLTAAIYARYSSDLQKESSIDDQVADCRGLAKREDYKVIENLIISDAAKSGTSRLGRDGIAELIEAVRARKFDVLICESQSRLARDPEDYAFLSKRLKHFGVILHTVHDGVIAHNNMMGSLRSMMDAEYIETLRKNVQRSMRGRARLGFRPGQVTYGYRQVAGGQPGEWEIDPVNAKIVRRIFSEFAAGVPVRELATSLTRDGIPTPRARGGNAWGHQAFLGGGDGGIISNQLYIGKSLWGKQYYVKDPDTGKISRRWRPEAEWVAQEVPHLRIIDQQLWEAAQRVRQGRQQNVIANGVVVRRTITRNKEHLLSGLVRCGKCEGKMIIACVSKGKRYVKCAAAHMKSACDHTRTYDIDKLRKLVIDNMCLPGDAEFEARQKQAYNQQFAKSAKHDNKGERAEIEKQIAKLKVQQARIADLITDGDIDVDVAALKNKLKAKEVERVGLAERLRRLGGDNVVTLPNSYDAYRRNVEKLQRRLIDEVEDEATRIAFRNVMDSIVVQPTVYGEPYIVDGYGRPGAGEVDLFPKPRSVNQIVAAEGLPAGATAAGKVTPYCPHSSDAAILLGRWKAAA